MRFCEAGSIQDAVQRAYEAAGGVKKVSDALGILPSTLSYGTEVREDRPGGLGVNYLDRLARMSPASAQHVARHFSAIAGGVFHPIAEGGEDLSSLCAVIAKEGGEAQAAAIRAAHSASQQDYRKALREIDESIEAQTRARAEILARLEKTVPLRGVVS
ncbi:hypothetical protein DEM26_18085 [Thioclava sp. NG1]|uniref:hypothetical protein n=1 Tax=Thioclava sp. NG1 TaxID=2182426 RepID=UPI000D6048F3|nr:hypothetical protein [Thioclava sp. NG1]PWE48458.1 hypothetical protein DEM26_18085 [Thioclava sp. NG1]